MKRSIIISLPGLLITMAGVTAAQSSIAAEPTANKTPAIESRLRDLEYPELRKRTTEEIEVFKDLVLITDQTFKRIESLYRLGAKGGQAEMYEQAGLNAELAKAELAWAEGRVEDAYAHTYRAVRFSNRSVKAVAAAYETGTITVDCLFDSQIRWAKTRLQLIRAEKVAKAAGIDLTAVKRREKERYEEIKPIPENPPSIRPEPPRPIPAQE